MVLVVQVRSSVMCTPRNLVLQTLSTVELSMVSGVPPPEVHHNLLCLLRIEGQIVTDETYHCCVISELDDVVGAELGSAVMGQQREEQRAEHTALWGTCAQCGSARGVVADTD